MKGIACVILLLGLLKFAQDAPKLFSSIFSFGGDLLKGMSLDPRTGMKDLTNAAKRTGSTALGALGGAASGIARGVRNGGKDYDAVDGKHTRFGRGLHTLTSGIGGGIRGMVRGGRGGFQNPSGNVWEQLRGGTEQGNIAAQMNSQHYRDGGNTNIFRRTGHNIATTAGDVWNEHIAEPAGVVWGNITGKNTASEAAQMFTTTKANNTAAMTATGTDVAVSNLTKARDDAKEKIREASALGMSFDETLDKLGMDAETARKKAAQLVAAGYTVKNFDTATGQFTADADSKTLQDIVDGVFKTDKTATLKANFDTMNEENKKIIAKYNEETVSNFSDNVSLLSDADKNALFSGMAKDAAFHDALIANGMKIVENAQGKKEIQTSSGSLATNDQIQNFVMNQLNASTSKDTVDATSMMQLDALQTQLKKVNNTIENRKALEEHKKSSRKSKASGDSGGSSSGGSSGGSGGGK